MNRRRLDIRPFPKASRRWANSGRVGHAACSTACALSPWGQTSFYSGYFESVNISIILLDLAYVFGFPAGIVMLLLGFNWLVGWMTLLTLPAFFICAASVYRFQRRLPDIANPAQSIQVYWICADFREIQSIKFPSWVFASRFIRGI